MHRFVLKIERMRIEGKLPTAIGLHHVTVKHDEWCALLKGNGECNCDPDIEVLPDRTN